MLEFKAEIAGALVVRVNPRGTSEGLSHENPMRDLISACKILMRGWGSPDSPVEMKPLWELIYVPASLIVEAGSPHPFRGWVAHGSVKG
jgi:putative transposase